jgi:hypothetical protein
MRFLCLLAFLAGCPSPTIPFWEGRQDTSAVLAVGENWTLYGIGEPVDIVSADPTVATGTYYEYYTHMGNDGPGGYDVVTRSVVVSGIAVGSTVLTLKRRGGGDVLATTPIVVAAPATLTVLPITQLLSTGEVTPQLTRQTADGTAIVGDGSPSCTATGAVTVDVGCYNVTGMYAGPGDLTVQFGKVSATEHITVVLVARITSVTIGALSNNSRVHVDAATAGGPVWGIDSQLTCIIGDGSTYGTFNSTTTGAGEDLFISPSVQSTVSMTCTLGSASATAQLTPQ